MPSSWQEEGGLRFLHVDYRGLSPDEMLATLAEVVREVETAPPGVRMLIEVEESAPDSRFLNAVKKANHTLFGPSGARTAFLGAEGQRASVLRGINAVGNAAPGIRFLSRDQALAFLARD